jgi:Zn-finger nucleic acid-binding protein
VVLFPLRSSLKILAREVANSKGVTVNCPIDQGALSQQNYEADIKIDVCANCQGVWLDSGELEKIQESLEHDYSVELQSIHDFAIRAYAMARTNESPARDCPSCGVALDRSEYGYCSQILVDKCRQCRGVWLDREELQALEVFFERSRLSTSEIRRGFFGGLLGSVAG